MFHRKSKEEKERERMMEEKAKVEKEKEYEETERETSTFLFDGITPTEYAVSKAAGLSDYNMESVSAICCGVISGRGTYKDEEENGRKIILNAKKLLMNKAKKMGAEAVAGFNADVRPYGYNTGHLVVYAHGLAMTKKR